MCSNGRAHRLGGPHARWQYDTCDTCQHRWLTPMPTVDELREYYNGAYSVPRERYAARARQAYPATRALLASGGIGTGRVLEIGCSYGELLASFAADGWQVRGIEIDQRACTEAAARLGGGVLCGTLEDFIATSPTERFDAVVAFHVVEHIVDPRAFLRQALGLLRPGGVLLLKTPNAASLVSRLAAGWWEWASPPEHVHLFSARSITAALREAGATSIAISSRSGDANRPLFEFARSTVRRALRRPAGGAHYAAGTVPLSHRGWYRSARAVDDLLELPIDRLLATVSRGERQLGAELTIVARAAS